MQRLHIWAMVVTLSLTAACSVKFDASNKLFRCTSNSDCRSGFVCSDPIPYEDASVQVCINPLLTADVLSDASTQSDVGDATPGDSVDILIQPVDTAVSDVSPVEVTVPDAVLVGDAGIVDATVSVDALTVDATVACNASTNLVCNDLVPSCNNINVEKLILGPWKARPESGLVFQGTDPSVCSGEVKIDGKITGDLVFTKPAEGGTDSPLALVTGGLTITYCGVVDNGNGTFTPFSANLSLTFADSKLTVSGDRLDVEYNDDKNAKVYCMMIAGADANTQELQIYVDLSELTDGNTPSEARNNVRVLLKLTHPQ